MALYMDLHRLEPGGLTAQQLAEGHAADLEVQEKYGVKYLTYWFNEAAGQTFCLVDAPSVNAAVTVHREAHGQLADEIIEVEAGQMAGFMGNGTDLPAVPEPVDMPGPERDRGTRTILFTGLDDWGSINQRLGDDGAMALLKTHNEIIRRALQAHDGSEVKHTGEGFMASFISASDGVECAISIQGAIAAHNQQASTDRLATFTQGGSQSLGAGDRAGEAVNHLRLRIGVNAGEPVTDGGELFGVAVQLAARICERASADQILVGGVIRELCAGKSIEFKDSGKLSGVETPVQLFEVPWQ
ncbi:MAG: nickel-binding protein [Dehalococcoidia bacterium]